MQGLLYFCPFSRSPTPLKEPYPWWSDFVKLVFTRNDIPSDTTHIMTALLSKSTLRYYNSTFSKWWSFCRGEIDTILQPNTKKILSFLQNEFDNGAQYSMPYRSALHLVCEKEKSFYLCIKIYEKHLKGHPQFPNHQETEDLQSALAYLSSLCPLDELNLELI
nr:unnamed protein product [Callosobruchus analis]